MKKLYLLMTAVVMLVMLFSCANVPTYTIDEIENDIAIGYAIGDDQDHVTQDLTLPHTSSFYTEAFITWQSNNQDVITHAGQVTRDIIDQEVTLIYSISYYGEARIGSIVVTVLADSYTLEEINAAIEIGFAEGDSQSGVTQDVTLPTVSSLDENATISWTSSNTAVMSHTGVITRGDSDVLVTLFYTISYHNQTLNGSYFLVVRKSDNYYTVTFETNGGSFVEDQTLIEDALVAEPTDPSKNGYTFVGWYSDASFNTLYDFNTPLNVDLTLYARWSLIEVYYTITFNVDGGSAVAPLAVSNLVNPVIPDSPVKEGYTFKGWYIDQMFTTQYFFNTPLTADITLYALWQENATIDYTGIYDGAEGLTEQALITFLYNVVTANIAGKEQDYGDARYTLDDTDEDPNNLSNVILVYLGTSVSGTWDGGVTWNREHVWPQSLLGATAENSTVNRASDLHNLKPSDPYENTSRSNKWFGESTTALSYEPRDEVKGDIARILFYMAVRYYDILTLVNLSSNQVPSTYHMGDLATLLIWNLQDPVDDFEMHRNDTNESIQGNRNPFIDYPEFATSIWG